MLDMEVEPTMTSTSNREIVLTRAFDAPRDRVFRAYTEPEHLMQWYGPNGFSLTIHEIDVRPGGMWRFMMHGPDGIDYPNRIVYTRVIRPELLEFDHGGDSEEDFPQFHVTVTFADVGGKTEVTSRLVFPTPEACQKTKDFGAIELGNQTFSRLAEYLKKMPS